MAEITQKHLLGDLTSKRGLLVQRQSVLTMWINVVQCGVEAADAVMEDLQKVESYLSSATIQPLEARIVLPDSSALGSELEAADEVEKDLQKVESSLSSTAMVSINLPSVQPRFVLCNNKKIALLQDEISCLDSEVYALENKERLLRGRYIRKKTELNNKERAFEKTLGFSLVNNGGIGAKENDGIGAKENDVMVNEIKNLQNKLVEEKRLKENLHKNFEVKKRSMERAITGLETELEYMSGRCTSLEIDNYGLKGNLARLEGITKDMTDDRNSWKEEKEMLIRDNDFCQEKVKLLGGARDNLLPDSALKSCLDCFPMWMSSMVAPKGQITGDELGEFIGALVTITAYIVSYSNKDIKRTALGGFAALLGILIGKMFNNIVAYISMDKTAGFGTSMAKAFDSFMWIILGGTIPILVGGFIEDWIKRLIVTSLVVLLAKVLLAYIWSVSYNVPAKKAVFVVLFGIVGIGIAAGVPHVLKKLTG